MKAVVSTGALSLLVSVLLSGCSQSGPSEGSLRRRLAPEYWPASTDDSPCECLSPYQDEFETSGALSVVDEAVTDCFSYDDPAALYDEVHCLPVYFDNADDSYPSIEIAYECYDADDCRRTGFIIPRFLNVDIDDCFFEGTATAFRTQDDSRYFGCVHDALWSVFPLES